MCSTFQQRYFKEPKQNDIKYNIKGQIKLLLICLNYQGTQSPLTCIVDGKRIIAEAQKSGVSQIVAMFDDRSTDLFPNRKNVLRKMGQMAASCNVGDFFIVYYSGHGTHVEDYNKDQQDGFDEAFCLMSQSGKYQFLSDDDTAQTMSKNLHDYVPCLFIVDACHSGSILDLTKQKVWNNKKIFSMSGCQDNQYSNDTGDGGQMTNVLLAVLRQHQHLRSSKQASLQYIFNRMVAKNKQIEGNYGGSQKHIKNKAYSQLQQNSGPSFLTMCLSALQLCINQSNIQQNQNYFQMIENVTHFNDLPGQHPPVNDQAKPGQWINLAWNGGSDPTKIPFPL